MTTKKSNTETPSTPAPEATSPAPEATTPAPDEVTSETVAETPEEQASTPADVSVTFTGQFSKTVTVKSGTSLLDALKAATTGSGVDSSSLNVYEASASSAISAPSKYPVTADATFSTSAKAKRG